MDIQRERMRDLKVCSVCACVILIYTQLCKFISNRFPSKCSERERERESERKRERERERERERVETERLRDR